MNTHRCIYGMSGRGVSVRSDARAQRRAKRPTSRWAGSSTAPAGGPRLTAVGLRTDEGDGRRRTEPGPAVWCQRQQRRGCGRRRPVGRPGRHLADAVRHSERQGRVHGGSAPIALPSLARSISVAGREGNEFTQKTIEEIARRAGSVLAARVRGAHGGGQQFDAWRAEHRRRRPHCRCRARLRPVPPGHVPGRQEGPREWYLALPKPREGD